MTASAKSIRGSRQGVDYLIAEHKGYELDRNLIYGETSTEIMNSFRIQQSENYTCDKKFFTAYISPDPKDGQKLTDKELKEISHDFMKGIGVNPEKQAYLAIVHTEKNHKHVHLLINRIDEMRQMNKPQQQKSVVLLDEAPTIYIPNIEQIPATARSNKIATIFGVQDFSQLVDNYGQDKAQIIISNLGNQFFGRVTNGKTAEMVKTLFSKEDRTFINKNTGTGTSGTVIHIQSNDSKSKSENIQERDRVKVSDLINLNPGEFYGIIAEGEPKEFLKTQFLEDFASDRPTSKEFVSDKEMSENYFRIIEESKNLI